MTPQNCRRFVAFFFLGFFPPLTPKLEPQYFWMPPPRAWPEGPLDFPSTHPRTSAWQHLSPLDPLRFLDSHGVTNLRNFITNPKWWKSGKSSELNTPFNPDLGFLNVWTFGCRSYLKPWILDIMIWKEICSLLENCWRFCICHLFWGRWWVKT